MEYHEFETSESGNGLGRHLVDWECCVCHCIPMVLLIFFIFKTSFFFKTK